MSYTQNDLTELIDQLTPGYNFYKANNNTISGTEALEIMWDLGSILETFIDKYGVAPHYLYRDIYGKGEGTTNTIQKSYITREFLGRCYRIKKVFIKKEDIKKEFPSLVSFTAFREAMPFFDNPKYKLEGKEREDLLKLLNSKTGKSNVIKAIRELQDKKIGISNPRTQRHGEVKKELFVEIYNYAKDLLKGDFKYIENKLEENNVTGEELQVIAKDLIALTDSRLHMDEIDYNEEISEPWNSFIILINDLANEGVKRTKRSRVVKVIHPNILIGMSDMITALVNEDYYNNFRRNYMK